MSPHKHKPYTGPRCFKCRSRLIDPQKYAVIVDVGNGQTKEFPACRSCWSEAAENVDKNVERDHVVGVREPSSAATCASSKPDSEPH